MKWNIKSFYELEPSILYDILKLRNEVFIVEQKCLYNDCDDYDKDSYHLYLEDNNKIKAYMRIVKKDVAYKQTYIGRVIITKDFRNKGLGKELISKAIDFIKKDLGENEIRVTSQQHAIGFYKSFGFKEISDVYLQHNIPRVDMILK